MPPSPPARFGRYEIAGLAEGAWRVHRAHDSALGRAVALKIFTEVTERDLLRLRDARAAAAKIHPNVVEIFEIGEVDGTPFVAMELVRGSSLRVMTERGPIPLATSLRWIDALARGLAAREASGLGQHDLRLENVMVRVEDSVVKLLDTGSRVEAPSRPSAVPAADTREWGRLAYALLIGSPPQGAGDAERLEASGASHEVQAIVMRALSARPADGLASMRDVVASLDLAKTDVLDRLDTVGAYRVIRKVSRESRSAMFEAYDAGRRRKVSLFAVHVEDATELARRLRSARAVAGLDHPSIAVVYEVGACPNVLYAVIEPTSALAPLDAATVIAAARGLSFAHKRGLAHGAVDPFALWMFDESFPKLVGFGMSAAGDPEADRRAWRELADGVLARLGIPSSNETGASDEPIDVLADAFEANVAQGPPESVTPPTEPALTHVESPRSRPIRAVAAAFVIIAAAIAASAFWSSRGGVRGAEQLAHASKSPTAPAGQRRDPNAQAAYDAALQSLRDVSYGWAANLETATKLDPSFAEAHLRRVLYASPWEEVREHYNRARALRAALDDHDRALLDAYSDWMATPPQLAGTEASLAAMVANDPNDRESLYLLCKVRYFAADYTGAIRACEQLSSGAPSYLGALRMTALARLSRNEIEPALAGYGACIEGSPAATYCLKERAETLASEGRCDEALLDVRRLLSLDSESWVFQESLAAMLAAVGEKDESIEIAIGHAVSRVPPPERAHEDRRMRGQLAILEGRFIDAERYLAEGEAAAASIAASVAHETFRRSRALIAFETGDRARGLELTREYWAQRSAWSRSYDGDDGFFTRIAEYRAGAMPRAAFVRSYDEWRAARARDVTRGRMPPALDWAYGIGAASLDERDAREALNALPGAMPLPGWRTPRMDEAVGETYLRAGNVTAALPFLMRASSSCLAWFQGVDSVHARALLGEAFERRGDTAKACGAYRTVISAWGSAVPRSVTAERARSSRARLKCAD